MYIEASRKPIGYHARLESPILQSFGGSESVSKCLSFYFNMFGAGMGQMNVYLVFIDGRKELLWKRSWFPGIGCGCPISFRKTLKVQKRSTAPTGTLLRERHTILSLAFSAARGTTC